MASTISISRSGLVVPVRGAMTTRGKWTSSLWHTKPTSRIIVRSKSTLVTVSCSSQPNQPRKQTITNASESSTVIPVKRSAFEQVSDFLTTLFPLWTVLSATIALMRPATFDFMTTNQFTMALSLLMFSMGITMTIEDFKRVLSRPWPVGVGFAACYIMMPALAFILGKLFGLSDAFIAGLVLVGSINGGQASNLCTYIAKGDVALSVIMTTSTTIGCIFMTPLIAKILLGAIVPVDAIGIAMSTIQVVLVPVTVGVILNKFVPKFCRAVEPASPVVGVVMTIILVGSAVAQCSADILKAGLILQFPTALLHLAGGLAGYFINKTMGFDEITSRTTAIETAMKSSAFGFLLASLHFSEYLVRVPSAVSVVWMSVLGSTMAVIWRNIPVQEKPKLI